jgi:hypothetical protein
MGLKKWLVDRAMANADLPDYPAVITAALGGDDQVRGHVFGYHSAYQRGGGGVGGGKLLTHAANAATNVVSGSKHVGGDEGSDARKLPRTGDLLALAIADQSVSLWDFGPMRTEETPTEVARFDRAAVASIERTGGGRKMQGLVEARVSFADGSFADYLIMDHESFADFWTAAAALSR